MPCICCESRFSVKMFRKVVWYFAVFAALIDLGEENVADSMDIEGDRLIQSGSLAIRHGSRVALRISGCIFFLAVVLTFVPFLLQWFSHAYIVPIAVMDIAIAYSTLRLLTSEHNKGRIHIRRLRTTQPLKTGGFHNLLFVFPFCRSQRLCRIGFARSREDLWIKIFISTTLVWRSTDAFRVCSHDLYGQFPNISMKNGGDTFQDLSSYHRPGSVARQLQVSRQNQGHGL